MLAGCDKPAISRLARELGQAPHTPGDRARLAISLHAVHFTSAQDSLLSRITGAKTLFTISSESSASRSPTASFAEASSRSPTASFAEASSRSPTASFAEASSPGSPLELGADFLVSPRCFQLYEIALKASESPVPDDWKEQLSSAVEELPEEASVQELVKVVAELSPDRARTLIQVLEEEVSVMEDVVDHEALERMKRMRREQQAELKALSANAKETRFAAIDLNGQLQSLYPGFNWGEYHSDPNYLQRVVYEREDMERLQEHDRIEEMIQQNQAEKKFLMAEIMELREKRAVLQSRLEDGCEMDLDEELGKAQRENQLLRRHYAHLCALVEQLESRDSTSSPSYSY